MAPEWLTLTEAAEWTQQRYAEAGKSISRKTVSRWAKDGKTLAEQRGRFWRVNAASLRATVAEELGETAPTERRPPLAESLRAFVADRNARFLRDLEAGID